MNPLLDLEGPTAEAVIVPALFGPEPTLLYLNACSDGRSLLGRPASAASPSTTSATPEPSTPSNVRRLAMSDPKITDEELASWLAAPEDSALPRIARLLQASRADLREAFGLPTAETGTEGLREALKQIIALAPETDPGSPFLELGGYKSQGNAGDLIEDGRQHALWEAAYIARAALARHKAPAVDVPAERERTARIVFGAFYDKPMSDADFDYPGYVYSRTMAEKTAEAVIVPALFGPEPGGAWGEIEAKVMARLAEVEAERLADLEQQLGVKGIAAVFRESLRLAKEATASTASSDAGGADPDWGLVYGGGTET